MTTTELAKLMYAGNDEAFEAAVVATGFVKITAKMADDIEAVASKAYDAKNYALETLCQLAQNGAARPARLVLSLCRRRGW